MSIAEIIKHSLGLSQSDTPYRNYYCADPNQDLLAAVEQGLMTGPHERSIYVCPIWHVTEAGAKSVGMELPR